jgi:hypothetical protein
MRKNMNNLSKLKNIYLYNMLNAPKTEIDNEYGYLLSRLMSIEYEVMADKVTQSMVAENVMNAINACEGFPKVDRVCIALAFPSSSKLKIFSSANSDRISPNTMGDGYSCFVSSSSSLFRIQKTDVRMYSDIDAICAQYGDRAIQRSMRRLREMGIKSGITISLPISDLVCGFLFLNSKEVGAFDQINHKDNLILCVLKLLGIHTINKFIHSSTGVDQYLNQLLAKSQETSNNFDAEYIINTMKSVWKAKTTHELKISITEAPKKILFAHKPFAYMLLRLLESTGHLFMANELQLEFKIDEKQSKLYINLLNIDLSLEQLAFMDTLFMYAGHEVSKKGSSIVFESNLELAQDNYDYSL